MILFGKPPQPVNRKISGFLPYVRSSCVGGELQGRLLSDFCSSGKTLREQRNQSAMAANNTRHLPEAAARKASGFLRMHLPFIHTFIRCYGAPTACKRSTAVLGVYLIRYGQMGRWCYKQTEGSDIGSRFTKAVKVLTRILLCAQLSLRLRSQDFGASALSPIEWLGFRKGLAQS